MQNKKNKVSFLKTGLLTLLMSAIFFMALNGIAYATLPGDDWGQNKDIYDMRSPDPVKYPWFMRQIPFVYYNPYDVDADGKLTNAVWGWADTFSGPGLGNNDPNKGRSGDTVTFVQLNLAANPKNSGTKDLFLPVQGAKDIMSNVLKANEKSFQGYPDLNDMHNKLMFNNVVHSQVPGMYKPSDPALKVSVPMPANVDQIPVGINQELFKGLTKTFSVATAADGNWYLQLNKRQPDGPPRAALFHRIDYTVQVKDASGKMVVKPIYELTADELNRGIIGSYAKDNAAEAATQNPGWDMNRAKPSKGFYRAVQSSSVYYLSTGQNVEVTKWHPNLMLGKEVEIPGAITGIADIAPDLTVTAPKEIKGKSGQQVQIPVTIKNQSAGYLSTTLAYRIHPLVGEPAGDPTWQPYDTWEKGKNGKLMGLGSWGEFPINIPETIKDKPVMVEVMVNHLGQYPFIESDWENNVAFVLLTPEDTLPPPQATTSDNLKVTITNKSGDPYPGNTVKVYATVSNASGKLITTDLIWRLNGKVISNISKFDVITQASSVVSFKMPSGSAKVEVFVNPNKNKPDKESNWNDNAAVTSISALTLPPSSGKSFTVNISAPKQVEPNKAWSYKVTVKYNWTRPQGYTEPPPSRSLTLTTTAKGKQTQGYNFDTGNISPKAVTKNEKNSFTLTGGSSKTFTYNFPGTAMINEGYYVTINSSLNTGASDAEKVYVKPLVMTQPGVVLDQ